MTEIAPGAVVTCRQTGEEVHWVVVGQDESVTGPRDAEHVRFILRAKRVDQNGRHDFTTRSGVGEADITPVADAPTYTPGQKIGDFEVVADYGDRVELLVPKHSHPVKDGRLLYEAGNHITISKAEIVLELMD